MFDTNGPSLRTATQLKDGGVYEAPLDRRSFLNLYPFLPQHFEILLQLLGRLARKTGGLGLRSAIKVVQDVLVDRGGRKPGEIVLADAASRDVGEHRDVLRLASARHPEQLRAYCRRSETG